MILTVFRSRLKAGAQAEYDDFVHLTSELAEQAPGFRSHKMFVAEDGERVTLVEFDSMEAQRGWSLSREHVQAAIAGRKRFYSEYTIQICEVLRESRLEADAGDAASVSEPAAPNITG